MKFSTVICLGLALVLCAACARFARKVPPGAGADASAAILYGHFHQKHPFSSGLRAALWLQEINTLKPVYITFDETQTFSAVQVKPGKYQIVGLIGSNRAHAIRGRESLAAYSVTHSLVAPFVAGPGAQIYLGDFTVEARPGPDTLEDPFEHWKITGITNTFRDTTLEFREKYPKLMTTPAQSIFLPRAGS